MFSEAPELYDVIYGTFKDYDAEAEQIAEMLRRVAPGARTVLDVGCGTGEHAVRLNTNHGFKVSGLDIEGAFVDRARTKLPEATFWQGDMADFQLDLQFDAIICLFSSIGYLTELSSVEAAARCFLDHLKPGGVALVEPWFTPGEWSPGGVYLHTGELPEGRVVRMSHSTVEGSVSRLEFHYLTGSADGIDHRVEHHELGLFETSELESAFRQAGFARVQHDPDGLIGRGMLIATAG